jgi:hypothetical protein
MSRADHNSRFQLENIARVTAKNPFLKLFTARFIGCFFRSSFNPSMSRGKAFSSGE